MKSRLITLLLVTFMSGAIPAFSQATSAAPPTKIENIQRLIKITKGDNVRDAMMEQMLTALKPMFASAPSDDPRAQRMVRRLSDLLIEELKKIDFNATTIALYDKYFTNEDILGLIRFYESPLGQKATQVLPALVQESMARGEQQGQQAGAAAFARLAQEFPEINAPLQGVNSR